MNDQWGGQFWHVAPFLKTSYVFRLHVIFYHILTQICVGVQVTEVIKMCSCLQAFYLQLILSWTLRFMREVRAGSGCKSWGRTSGFSRSILWPPTSFRPWPPDDITVTSFQLCPHTRPALLGPTWNIMQMFFFFPCSVALTVTWKLWNASLLETIIVITICILYICGIIMYICSTSSGLKQGSIIGIIT